MTDPAICRRNTYATGWLTFGHFIIEHLRVFIDEQLTLHVGSGMVVTDIGCGEQPWRKLIAGLGGKYIGIDLQQNKENSVDILSDLNVRIELSDNCSDIVLFTEVLEHLRLGGNALPEIERILKPGGIVILTTPFVYRLHEEPYDFGRFTTYYFAANAGLWGFDVIDLRQAGNSVEVLATIWDDFWCLERNGRKFSLPRRIWNTGMRAVAHSLTNILNASGLDLPRFYYLNTLCVLRKKGSPPPCAAV